MKAETKTATLRLPVQMVDELTANGAMLNPAIVDLYNRTRAERKIKMLDIRGVFTAAEWLALVGSFNGTIIDEYMRYNADMVVAHCEDAERYEGDFSTTGADLTTVCNKLARLTRIQLASVLDRIEDYWRDYTNININEWADY